MRLVGQLLYPSWGAPCTSDCLKNKINHFWGPVLQGDLCSAYACAPALPPPTYMYTLCKFVFGKKLTVLRIEPRALNMIGNQSTSTLYPQLWNLFFSITNLSYFVCVEKKIDREGTRLFGTNKETVERVMKWIWSKYIMFIQEHMIMKATLLYS